MVPSISDYNDFPGFLAVFSGVASWFLFPTIILVVAKCIFSVSCIIFLLCCYVNVYGTVSTIVPTEDVRSQRLIRHSSGEALPLVSNLCARRSRAVSYSDSTVAQKTAYN